MSAHSDRREHWEPFPTPVDLSGRGYFFGTSGYYFDDWIGRFNPPKHLQKGDDRDRLKFYLRYFPFLEINTTFYREQPLSWFESVAQRSGADRLFSIKVHRDISHTRTWDFASANTLLQNLIEATHPLRERNALFSVLVQIEDRVVYTPKRLTYLLDISRSARDKGVDTHVEFRHISWHRMEVFQALEDSETGVCNTEIPPVDNSIFPLKHYRTSPKGYLRYSGLNIANWRQPPQREQRTHAQRTASRNARYNYKYSSQELDARLRGQIALRQKTECVAVAFNNHYAAAAVENAIENMRRLDAFLRGLSPETAP